MRPQALAVALVTSILLCGCSSLPFIGKKTTAPVPAPGSEEEGPSAPVPVALPEAKPGDAEKLETPVAPPRKPGFFSKLAKRLGSDSSVPNVGACPAVRVLYDAQRFVELYGTERFENVGYTGEIINVNSDCRYVDSDPISIELQLDMAFGKGPKANAPSKDVSYWVSVTRKDLVPISTQRFVQHVVIPAGTDRITVKTPVTQLEIPRANKDISGVNFEVLVGFDLTPEQLEFNRNGKRFRVDAGVPR